MTKSWSLFGNRIYAGGFKATQGTTEYGPIIFIFMQFWEN